jgi:hypothetical protein
MVAYHTSPLSALLLFCALFPIVRTYQPLTCRDYTVWDNPPLLDDCCSAVKMIPSGSLIFSGEGGLSWTIEAKAHSYRSMPAKFTYRTCAIWIRLESKPHLNPRPARNLARAIYFNAWPVVKTAAKRLLDQCVVRNQGGMTYAPFTINENDFLFSVAIWSSATATPWLEPKYYHDYVGGQEPAPLQATQAKQPWWKSFAGCHGCPSTATKQ